MQPIFMHTLFLFVVLLLLPRYVFASVGGEVEANADIPYLYEYDATDEYLEKCSKRGMACYPLKMEQSVTNFKPTKTWSLFLVCSPSLLKDSSSSDLESLYRKFVSFGRALGEEHASVWFVKRKTTHANPASIENLDINRNVSFCTKYKLNREHGPFVVVTNNKPNTNSDPDTLLILSLDGLSSTNAEALLSMLATQVANEKPNQPL